MRHRKAGKVLDRKVGPRRALVTAVEHLGDLAVVVDDKAGQPLDIAFGVDAQAVDVVDQGICKGRGCSGEGDR